MSTSNQTLFDALRRHIAPYGVRVGLKAMDLEKSGEFDGPTITINPLHDLLDKKRAGSVCSRPFP